MNKTDSLGDFMNGFPVLKGIYDSYGKYDLVIKSTNRKFKGFKELLMYQNIFESVMFEDEVFVQGALPLHVVEPVDETSENPKRPAETSRWANSVKKLTGLNVKPDDSVELKIPELNIEFDKDKYIVGDRWNGPQIDGRRAVNVLSHLENVDFLNYNNDLLTNCYLIKNSNKPFISNFTGSAVLADLLNKESYIVWRKEYWAPQFWNGDDIIWDGGKNIQQCFERHFYTDRNCKLIHATELEKIL